MGYRNRTFQLEANKDEVAGYMAMPLSGNKTLDLAFYNQGNGFAMN
jgi:hypothetical protein